MYGMQLIAVGTGHRKTPALQDLQIPRTIPQHQQPCQLSTEAGFQ